MITQQKKINGDAAPAKRSRDASVARPRLEPAAPGLHAIIAGITGLESAHEFERVNKLMLKSESPELWDLYTSKLRKAVSQLGCCVQ